jgi:hypothetical protein
VQIFFTNANPFVTGPANVFAPSAGNTTDSLGVDVDGNATTGDGYGGNTNAFPAAFAANTTVAPGETAYIWARFTQDTQVPYGYKCQGMDLVISGAPTDIAYYVFDNTLIDNGTAAVKRWDGDPGPGYANFKSKPEQVLVAVQTYGIPFGTSNLAQGYKRSGTTGAYVGTALLGAVKFDAAGVYSYSLGTKGISMALTTGEPIITTQLAGAGTLTVTPEPASLVLLGLAGLLIRRR